jgi:hypothetical protein
MGSKSIIILTNKIIRIFPFVKEYQGVNPGSSVQDHVGSSMIFSLMGTVLGFLTPWLMFVELIMWGYYAFYVELVKDKKKNEGRPKSEVWAQIFERSVGFVILAPLKFLILLS